MTMAVAAREDCIRCKLNPDLDDDKIPAAVDALGYCGHCHWAIRNEVEEGMYALRLLLAGWWRFTDWCNRHEQEPW